MIIFSVVCLVARLFLLQEMVPMFSCVEYVKKVIFHIAFAIIPTITIVYFVHRYVQDVTWKTFMYESSLCVILSLFNIIFLGLTREERDKIFSLVMNKIRNQ